jgi:hypothetical protein
MAYGKSSYSGGGNSGGRKKFEIKDNTFTLFVNDKRDKDGNIIENRPDFTGKGLFDGVPVYVSAWKKKTAKGTFLSGSVKPQSENTGSGSSGNNEKDNDRDANPFS